MVKALVGKPKLLLLDEHTEGIQLNIIFNIENTIKKIIFENSIGFLAVEKILDFVQQAERYYVMQRKILWQVEVRVI